MRESGKSEHGSLHQSILAEFLKIYSFRIPQIAYGCITAFMLLFVIQLFYFERLSAHLGPATVTEVIPYLFFASWKTILFHLFLLAFGAYCTAVDSQYGMIRIGCTQPVSRAQYVLGKTIAIELHVALFGIVYVSSLLFWVGVCTGGRGLSLWALAAVVSLTARTIVFCVGFVGWVIAVSILRKSLLDAVVSSFVVFAFFGLLTTLPTRFHVEALLFLRYFFYPIAGMIPRDWPIPFPMQDAPLWQFLLVSICTPVICFIPAMLHFHYRDICE